MSSKFGVVFEHRIDNDTVFRVERDADGLSWEFQHGAMWVSLKKDDASEVTYYGLLDAAATLRRWSVELTQKAHELATPELTNAEYATILEVDD